jgi:hypothetical protein
MTMTRRRTPFAARHNSAVQTQVNSQYQRHSIAGTLVLSVVCTHKNALVFAPYFMDVDKAVQAWNKLNPGNEIKTNSVESIAEIEARSDTAADGSFSILSGATFGSSFVAMVHVLNTTTSESSQYLPELAEGGEGRQRKPLRKCR